MKKVEKIKKYPDGITLICPEDFKEVDPKYALLSVDYGKIRRHFLNGLPVPKCFTIVYQGRTYGPGECYSPAPETEPTPKADAAAPAPKADAAEPAPKADPANAPQAAKKAPVSAPSLDMFDNTDPNAPRTMDQNNAFWGLMDRLGKLTGRTGEEMKTVVVSRALGENKGTSKLTIAEMDKVIQYVKQTIELFESHDCAVKSAEVR